jgi:dephospho-CoA kinase
LTVAVVGLAGAGKSEVCELLVARHGFQRVYFGQVVLDELTALGLEPGAESERLVRERLRADEGMAVMAARSLPAIRRALADGRGVCIDGLYSTAEWELLAREIELVSVAVHASRRLRKARLAARPVRPLTGAELDRRDLTEIRNLDKAPPIALADAHLVNDGTREDLRLGVQALLEHVGDVLRSRLRPA